ncbi:MAG: hypothetical protein KDB22_02710, partial [Planctomycetales bacterium]|nr:hypothetical protein [Planctomycetales bacterium]
MSKIDTQSLEKLYQDSWVAMQTHLLLSRVRKAFRLRPIATPRWRFPLCLWLLVVSLSCVAVAEEPYERFLDRLRQEQLFDLALVYLNDLESRRGVTREFKSEIELERGLLEFQAAAILMPTNSTRPTKLNDAESHLRKFLAAEQNHPRRSEARLKLGELLLTRAEEERTKVGETTEDVPAAIKFYGEAHELFESTIKELAGLLENLKGNRVNLADKAKVAIREQIQRDLRQAQLLSAKSVEEMGKSRAQGSSQREADLTRALTMFGDLYTKERRLEGIRNYALFYRSKLHSELGNVDDAIEGFQRLADSDSSDELRPLQASAINELVQQLAKRKKFPLATDRATQWLSDLRPDESATSETLALKLTLSRVKTQWAEDLLTQDPNDRVGRKLNREARDELRLLMRVPGPHLVETRELLSRLGTDDGPSSLEKVPDVKDFAQALAAATERLNTISTDSVEHDRLAEQIRDASGQQKESLQQQLQESEQRLDTLRSQTVDLLQKALQLYGNKDDRAQLFEARYRLAMLHLQQQQPWEALAIGRFLSKTNPGSDIGLNASAVALAALSDLLRSVAPERQVAYADILEPLANHLIESWPQSKEAAAATAAMVQLSLLGNEWEKAESLLQKIAANGSVSASLRRDVGLSLYSAYMARKKEVAADDAELKTIYDKAMNQLEAYLDSLGADQLNSSALEAVNATARLAIEASQLDKADEILFSGENTPVATLNKDPKAGDLMVALDSYRLAIRLRSAQMAAGTIAAAQATDGMAQIVSAMQKVADSHADGHDKLAAVFVGLARDLQDLFSSTENAAEKKRLAEVLVVVAVQAAKQEVFNVQYWAADLIIMLAEELGNQSATERQAGEAYAAAGNILDGILS